MIYKRSEYPQWSWSSSRKGTFTDCLRKYYYNYYLAHNGWEDNASEYSQLAWKLKNLSGIHLIFGTAVHEAAEKVCRSIDETGEPPSEKSVKEEVRGMLNDSWRQSQKPRLWENDPKRNIMLSEFYYRDGLSEKDIAKVKAKLNSAIPNILESRTVKELMEEGCRIRITEGLDTFSVAGTPVYAIPDLVYERSDGKWIVVDWKTGRKDESHLKQINTYALYLIKKHNIAPDNITGRIEYLVAGKCTEFDITSGSVKRTVEEIEQSMEDMKNLLEDEEENKPLDMESFPLTEDRKFCPWCNYYELCQEEIEGGESGEQARF